MGAGICVRGCGRLWGCGGVAEACRASRWLGVGLGLGRQQLQEAHSSIEQAPCYLPPCRRLMPCCMQLAASSAGRLPPPYTTGAPPPRQVLRTPPACCPLDFSPAGWHEFAEFTAEDVGTVDSGLNSMVGLVPGGPAAGCCRA